MASSITKEAFAARLERGEQDDASESSSRRTFHRPMRHCAVVSLTGFVLFIVEGTVAVLVHDKVTMVASGVFDGTILVLMLALISLRLVTSRKLSCFPTTEHFC